MTDEKDIQSNIMLRIGSRQDCRLFRNNTGVGWVGRLTSNRNGGVTLAGARPLRAGLCVGSSDLIGWIIITITPEMVGRQIATFTAIEVKSMGGAATPEQLNFINAVREAGGVAGVARSPDDAATLIEEWAAWRR